MKRCAPKVVTADISDSPQPAKFVTVVTSVPAPPEREPEPQEEAKQEVVVSEPPAPPAVESQPAPKESGSNNRIFTFVSGSLFEFSSETGRKTQKPCNFKVYADSAWCVLPTDSIFICGGGQGDKNAMRYAGELVVASNESKEHAQMTYCRSHHAAIYAAGSRFAHNGVFVLGGNDEFGVSAAGFEVYNIQSGQWTELENLPKPLYKTSASFSGDSIVFTDFGARSIFSYDLLTDEFNRIRIQVPQDAMKVICCLPDSTVVLLDNKAMQVTGDSSKDLLHKGGLNYEIQTNCPTVFHNGFIYFVSGDKTMKYTMQNGYIEATN